MVPVKYAIYLMHIIIIIIIITISLNDSIAGQKSLLTFSTHLHWLPSIPGQPGKTSYLAFPSNNLSALLYFTATWLPLVVLLLIIVMMLPTLEIFLSFCFIVLWDLWWLLSFSLSFLGAFHPTWSNNSKTIWVKFSSKFCTLQFVVVWTA